MSISRSIQSRGWKFVVLVTISALIMFFVIEHFVFPHLMKWLLKKPTAEIVAIATLFITISGIALKIIFYRLENYPILNLDLGFNMVDSSKAIITAKVENSGGGKLIPRTAHILVDEGVISGNTYIFPKVMKYLPGMKHCQLAYACHSETGQYPNEIIDDNRFINTFKDYFPLRYLSESLSHIAKSEWFSESIAITFPKAGVYRVIFVFSTSDDKCRCRCMTLVVK